MPNVGRPVTPQRILSTNEIQQLAYGAGFRGDALRWAVAVALAESGGNPAAYNPEIAAGTKPGGGSRGLWQIYGTAHPKYNSSLAFDPVVNARAAYEVYKEAGSSFRPWSAYTKGTAKPFYDKLGNMTIPEGPAGTGAAALGVASGGPASTLGGYQGENKGILAAAQQNAQALSDIASGKFIENIFSKFDKVSFAFYTGGILLMVIGLVIIFIKPATTLVVEGTKAAVTGGLSTVL